MFEVCVGSVLIKGRVVVLEEGWGPQIVCPNRPRGIKEDCSVICAVTRVTTGQLVLATGWPSPRSTITVLRDKPRALKSVRGLVELRQGVVAKVS